MVRAAATLLSALGAIVSDPLVWRLAWRNVTRNGRRSGIVSLAVAVGIAGVFVTNALSYGMLVQMLENAIESDLGHIQVHARGYDQKPGLELLVGSPGPATERIRELPDVRAVAPRVRAEGLLFSPRASAGVSVVGIDPAAEERVTSLAASLVAGRYLGSPEPRQVVIGEALGRRLEAGVGAKLVLSVQDLAGDMTGEPLRVAGVYRTASRSFDERTVFLDLEEAQDLFGLEEAVSELVVRVAEREQVAPVQRSISGFLGGNLEVRSWEELAPFLVYMVDAYGTIAWVVYAAVFVAMAFGIANVLLMSVYERIREIGVMMAVGMHPRRLVATILAESLLLSLAGLALGIGIAGVSYLLLRDGIDLSRFSEGMTAFGIGTRLTPVARGADLLVPALTAVVTAAISSLWPALRAARVRPADAVRSV